MLDTSCKLERLGMINALGANLDEIRHNLFERCASGLRQSCDFALNRSVPLGLFSGELHSLPDDYAPFDSRNSRLIVSTFDQIRADVEKLIQKHGSDRIGVVIGTSTSGIEEGEKAFAQYTKSGVLPTSYHLSQQEPGSCATVLARYAGVKGPCYGISTACSSSAKVFRSARNLLRMGLCDAVIAGGSDSLCKLTVRGFSALDLVSEARCNPFSRNRCGINIGEGAALFVLTRDSGGIQLLGVGESSDAYHMSSPDPSGRGAEKAILSALQEAQLEPEQISYVNLHGTGTKHNDAMESKVIERIFGSDVPCSSTKPFVGHLLGAAGATEIGFCWLMLSHGTPEGIPLAPHLWDGMEDPELGKLNLVRKGATLKDQPAHYMLSNSFAFGGSNCSLIIGKRSPL